MRGRPRHFRLTLNSEEKAQLIRESTESGRRRALRAQILLLCDEGLSHTEISKKLSLSPGSIQRTLIKYRQGGINASLSDKSRSGRPVHVNESDRTLIKLLACQKPFSLPDGPQASMWTLAALKNYLKNHAKALGHPELENISEASIRKILDRTELCLRLAEKNRSELTSPLGSALLYKRLEFLCAPCENCGEKSLKLSNGDYGRILDPSSYEIVSLMIGIDLFSGRILGLICRRHTAREFISFLELLENFYSGKTLNFILDRHPVHVSAPVSAFIQKSKVNFNLVFEPQAVFVLDAIEKLLSKFIRLDLDGLTAPNFILLQQKVKDYFERVNQSPAASRWRVDLSAVKPFLKSFI